MKLKNTLLGVAITLLTVVPPVAATGVYTCDPVPSEDWKSTGTAQGYPGQPGLGSPSHQGRRWMLGSLCNRPARQTC